MASTVWKGQLTFGLVSFPVRLVRAARKDRIPLRYVREIPSSVSIEDNEPPLPRPSHGIALADGDDHEDVSEAPSNTLIAPLRQAYVSDQNEESLAQSQLQRGYEVAPGQFAVVRSEELRRLRQPTSPAMEIVRSVHLDEIGSGF